MALRNVCLAPVFWSWTTACRCVNVPRSTSCPVNRTGMPSKSSVPKASCSAKAHGTWSSSAIAWLNWSSRALSRRWTAKPSGSVVSALPTFLSVATSTPVLPYAPRPTSRGDFIEAQCCPQMSRSQSHSSRRSYASLKVLTAWSTTARDSSTGMTGCVAAQCSTYLSRTFFCLLTAWYIIGCVKVGSSISLWPYLRYPMRSMTTSVWNSWRHATASSKTRHTASGSSALTWKIGHPKALPRSDAYIVERPWSGFAVKPTWLLQMTWIAPPHLYASKSTICIVS
mmetsp:Transcript_23826/g.94461  ORF Transcript_23826/g.94461 Transcript_23826/m.94461 type:complete len:283 (+) Transcript_23826:1347-2195(+)